MKPDFKIVLLDAATLGNIEISTYFKDFGTLEIFQTSTLSEVPERIRQADIIITNKAIVGKEAMDAASNLKLICVAATGMNNIDLSYAKEKNIPVKNVSGYSTMSVVQQTFALLFGLLNQVEYFDSYVKNPEGYSSSTIFTHFGREFSEIEGKTFGIIGLGTIGKKTAEIAKVFGAEVIYYSTSGANSNPEFKRVPLNDLLRNSDIISIHAPLNENTKGLISIEKLRQMKKTAVILNTGRGGIINEQDLAIALNEKIIAGAGLDVFENEPIKSENPLLHLTEPSRLRLSPHIAWASVEARQRLMEGITENIKDYIKTTIK